jgi:hypothetical protein
LFLTIIAISFNSSQLEISFFISSKINACSSISVIALKNRTLLFFSFKGQLEISFLFIDEILFVSLSLLFEIKFEAKSKIC